MPYPQHFIVEGRYLGTAMRKLQTVHESRQIPWSFVYFCPICGEVWARCPVEYAPGQFSIFQAMNRSCRKHRQTATTQEPGTLMLSWEQEYNDSFPDEVVKWEFDRVMEHLERKENGNP